MFDLCDCGHVMVDHLEVGCEVCACPNFRWPSRRGPVLPPVGFVAPVAGILLGTGLGSIFFFGWLVPGALMTLAAGLLIGFGVIGIGRESP